jgi:hypothetical protein
MLGDLFKPPSSALWDNLQTTPHLVYPSYTRKIFEALRFKTLLIYVFPQSYEQAAHPNKASDRIV